MSLSAFLRISSILSLTSFRVGILPPEDPIAFTAAGEGESSIFASFS
jgi:hypothetical protein